MPLIKLKGFMKFYNLIVIFLVSCSSFSKQNTTHWNIQLSKYNERFEKRLDMAHNSLWVIDYQKVKIDQKYKKQNIFLAHLELNESFNYDQFLEQYKTAALDGVAIQKNPLISTFAAKLKKDLKNQKIYLILNDYNNIALSFKNIDGIILSNLFFKAHLNKEQEQLNKFIKDLKDQQIDLLSVEFSTSLNLMQEYQKFINKNKILGLITDSQFKGASFLHFVEQI